MIALFFGTRPQVIKASVLRDCLATVGPVRAVDTGQHYDYALHRVHFDQLGVHDPDASLGVGSGSHATQTGAILAACEAWLIEHRPRLAVVIGDTNSTLACALAAVKLGIPVAHVEAGLRAANRYMAEEINRRVVDTVAELLFAPCERAARTLSEERADGQIETVGDVARDVLRRALPRTPPLEQVTGFNRAAPVGGFVYATLHRAELVDSPSLLGPVIAGLGRAPLPCLLAAHPRTVAALQRAGLTPGGAIRVIEPVGYLESVALARDAAVVVTDSGGLQREAYWLGVPCVTVRSETEWVETIACGANRLVPPDQADGLPRAVEQAARARGATWNRDAYGDGHAADRIAAILANRLQDPSSSSR